MIKKERSLVSKSSNSLNEMIKRTSVTIKQHRKITSIHLFTVVAAIFLISAIVATSSTDFVYAKHIPPNPNSNGNPDPHHPHDTLIGHVQDQKDSSFNPNCSGGHSFHIGADIDKQLKIVNSINPVNITISMKDWRNDAATAGFNLTQVIDCDARAVNDHTISIQIADLDPDKGEISTSSWYMRLVGQPNQNFTFNTFGNHTVSCDAETGACDFNFFEMGHVDLWQEVQDGDCPDNTFKLKGKDRTGNKQTFCDMTEIFLVELDIDGDGMFGEDALNGTDNDGDGVNGEDPGLPTDLIFGTAHANVNDDEDCSIPANIYNSFISTIHWAFGVLGDDLADACWNSDDSNRGVDLDPDMPGNETTTINLIDEDDMDDGMGGILNATDLVGCMSNMTHMSIDQDCDGLDGEDPGTVEHIFAVSCFDDPSTEINETIDLCPLGSSIWDVQQGTGTPTIQIFVVHDTMDVKLVGAKNVKGHDCDGSGKGKFCK